MISSAFEGLQPYYGDLHNHCSVGYGHGSAQDAFHNARLQLDFVAVTPHAHWPDIPAGETRLESLVAYHQKGFERTQAEWEDFQKLVEAHNEPGKLVTFLGYEWHSLEYGDHHILYNGSQGPVLREPSLVGMRARLRQLNQKGVEGMLIPHHIGYKAGFRGINWETFDPEFSPLVEIMSMHGASESDRTGYPYLHSMGPRDGQSTYQYGLSQGKIAGVLGSTDHHSAHPGSYGHGRAGVWAVSLTRADIWEALKARRTYALTGDRIQLAYSLNGEPMGSLVPQVAERQVDIRVEAGEAIDTIELIYNNRVLQRWSILDGEPPGLDWQGRCKVTLELGWDEKNRDVDWDVELQISGGSLVGIEPRFRGHDIVAPQAGEQDSYAFSQWQRAGENGVVFKTRTWGNPTTTTSNTQAMSLEIEGDPDTRLFARLNHQEITLSLGELLLR
ncbi:MAG TPA: DUF3604 domain-containing protein, partial [Anaerolineales bacterium]|nr:DUF3604 domain-containing protein [Anaerolineales bacterium]